MSEFNKKRLIDARNNLWTVYNKLMAGEIDIKEAKKLNKAAGKILREESMALRKLKEKDQ